MAKSTKVKRHGKIKIDSASCKGCQLCIKSCPKRLIGLAKCLNQRGVHPVYFKGGDCSGCALCARVCPECCIEVFKSDA